MQKTTLQLPEMLLVGLSIRTNYHNEINPDTAKIAQCVQQYFQQQVAEKILGRVHPGTTWCAYTEYNEEYIQGNAYAGDYTYFIGEEVSSLDGAVEGLDTLVVPAQRYAVFTTNPGPMPQVVIEAWHTIWNMSQEELGAHRKFVVDMELYDERAANPQDTVLDLYIGIE